MLSASFSGRSLAFGSHQAGLQNSNSKTGISPACPILGTLMAGSFAQGILKTHSLPRVSCCFSHGPLNSYEQPGMSVFTDPFPLSSGAFTEHFLGPTSQIIPFCFCPFPTMAQRLHLEGMGCSSHLKNLLTGCQGLKLGGRGVGWGRPLC